MSRRVEKEYLFIGYEFGTGIEVYIPYFHMLITGQTQMSGKTTLVKALARQAVERGYQVVIFDSKFNMVEFEGFGHEIPIPLRETTDALTLLGLLESIMGRKLPSQYLATLSRLTQNAKDFKQVLENSVVLEGKTKSPFVKDVARNINELLTRLIAQTADKVTSPELELKYPINRITMNKFALEGQQMIIKTAFEDALNHKRVIMILDEASKFLPQKYRSACDRAINHYVTQGAISKDFMWLATQFLATTSKDQMKAMDVKVLGRQSHDTECGHTVDLIPRTTMKVRNDDVMGLKLGHFYVVADEQVRLTYVCPSYADRAECQQVALGKREPQNVHYVFPGLISAQDVVSLVKKTENELIQIGQPVAPEQPPKRRKARKKKPEKVEKPETETVSQVSATPLERRLSVVEKDLAHLKQRFSGVEKIVVDTQKALGTTIDAQGYLTTSRLKLSVKPSWRNISFNTRHLNGKIMYLAKEGFFNQRRTLDDVISEIRRRGWTVQKPGAAQTALYKLVERDVLGAEKVKRKLNYTLSPFVEFVEEHWPTNEET